MKGKRQQEILRIIEEQDIDTQDQLLAELRARGLQSTQATISRDIKELHLIKELTGYGTYRYAVSERKASLNVASRLRTIFKEGVISFDLAQNIIVLKTMPGVASAACVAIDGMEITGLVGRGRYRDAGHAHQRGRAGVLQRDPHNAEIKRKRRGGRHALTVAH